MTASLISAALKYKITGLAHAELRVALTSTLRASSVRPTLARLSQVVGVSMRRSRSGSMGNNYSFLVSAQRDNVFGKLASRAPSRVTPWSASTMVLRASVSQLIVPNLFR